MLDKADGPMVKKILAEINMTENDLEEAVVHMKTWLQKQPHLPKSASDDSTLKAFIIGCKSVERAKTKLDTYFTMRRSVKVPYFVDRDPSQINYKACNKYFKLPGMTSEGYLVFMTMMPTKEEVVDFDPDLSTKVNYMLLDLYLREYHMMSGLYFVIDMTNLSVELTVKMGLNSNAESAKIFQDGYPIRSKGMIAFNAPPLAETFFNTFFKPFFNQKMKDRMFVYSTDSSCLEKYFPLEMLPKDYEGGKSPSVDELWEESKKKLETERGWLMKEGSESADETLRPQKDMDQMKGTFRKLQVE